MGNCYAYIALRIESIIVKLKFYQFIAKDKLSSQLSCHGLLIDSYDNASIFNESCYFYSKPFFRCSARLSRISIGATENRLASLTI